MTQADVAEKMTCTQSAVSKLEHAADAELTLQDIASYLHATGGRLYLGIGNQPNRVERIKELAICLKGELESLADLSSTNSDDPSIRQSINGFFGEAWFNLFKILCNTTSRLPKEPEETEALMLFGTESACVQSGFGVCHERSSGARFHHFQCHDTGNSTRLREKQSNPASNPCRH